MSKTLSPFPYFGGKARMSSMIASMLDYDSTNLYIEPFGGACRVLLNKPYHAQEIYNEAGHGLATFFEVMTSHQKTEMLIDRLSANPPSREQFEELLLQRIQMEDGLMDYPNKVLKTLASRTYTSYKIDRFRNLTKAVGEEDYQKIVENLDIICNSSYIKAWLEPSDIIQYKYLFDKYTQFYKIIKKFGRDELGEKFDEMCIDRGLAIPSKTSPIRKDYEKYKKEYINSSIKNYISNNAGEHLQDNINSNWSGSKLSDVDMAYIVFILYFSSRDGMATTWSDFKNKSEKAYIKAVGNLRNVSERMQGVVVENTDAQILLEGFEGFSDYKQHNVMWYLDPSYLQPEDEQKNLGEIYKMSYSYMEHERLLKTITAPDMFAKIIISNYDVELYNRYLCDWDKVYYETYAKVGSKKGNKRVEVLWKNF